MARRGCGRNREAGEFLLKTHVKVAQKLFDNWDSLIFSPGNTWTFFVHEFVKIPLI